MTPSDWTADVATARADGFTHFDWLDCVDQIGRADEFTLTLCLRNAEGTERFVTASVPRDEPRIESLRAVIPGIVWSEREIADLFGVEFLGGDPRPLLLPPGFDGHPLRKDAVAATRSATPWPGAKEPGETSAPSRRRTVPPGVPDPEVWGNRAPDADAADPAEVAASAEGGRPRRRGRR